MAIDDWLPPLMEFNSYGGNWNLYLEAIYDVFQKDFVRTSPNFRGRRLRLKKHPVIEGKEATFWHLTSGGKVESDRIPDFRRCERIRWPKPVIENEAEPEILVWNEPRGSNDTRIHIYMPNDRYLVVLADRGDYILPWTAFLVDNENGHQKYIKRHARYSVQS